VGLAAALRRGGGWGAWNGLVLNALLVVLLLHSLVDAIRMTSFPAHTWPF
jgi:hypothetical protein